MKTIFTFLSIFITLSISAQDNANGCDGLRYRSFVFPEVDTTFGVMYGSGNLFPSEAPQDLFYDVYTPANDIETERPVIILAFGGSFISGERSEISWLANSYAAMGYVAVSMDYRLFDGPLFPPPNASQMRDVVIRAYSDMKGVIKHLRQDADNGNTFGIDTDRIFVGGISAGSILACHAVMIDSMDVLPAEIEGLIEANGGFDGNTNDITGYSTEVTGVLNFSGGLNDASWYGEGDPILYSVHDENDGVVPFGTGFATVFGFPIIEVQGSEILHQQAEEFEIKNQLRVYENSLSHVGYFLNEQQTAIVIQESALFVHDEFCPEFATDVAEISADEVEIFPNPTENILNVSIHGTTARQITVSNSIGQKLLVKSNTDQVDLSSLTSGVYTLNIVDNDDNSITTKVVKQ